MLLENTSLNMKFVSRVSTWICGGGCLIFGNTCVHGTYLPLTKFKQLKCLYGQMTSSLDMFDFFSKYWQDLSNREDHKLDGFCQNIQKFTYVVGE